ncbi:hypothetical protein PP714_09735 [Lacticaseibacillus paracasei]|nr:hypothetical protein [Lacticaseibacillus paracasei]
MVDLARDTKKEKKKKKNKKQFNKNMLEKSYKAEKEGKKKLSRRSG